MAHALHDTPVFLGLLKCLHSFSCYIPMDMIHRRSVDCLAQTMSDAAEYVTMVCLLTAHRQHAVRHH